MDQPRRSGPTTPVCTPTVAWSMQIARPPISVIIPTWNALRYLPACLTALQAQLNPCDEIILVDNASRDHAGEWVRRCMPSVRVIELPHNVGFAGGTNAGIQAARNDLFLLCNDDALIEPGCITALWQALCAQPNAGAAAGVLTFSRAPHIIASAGITMQRNGVATDLGLGRAVTTLPAQPIEIFGASGGLALLHRAMFDDIGLFAVAFFNYLEDVDLAWRAQLRGWGCVLAPQARARHVYSASGVHGSNLKQRLLGRNRLRVIIRCLPLPLLQDCLSAIVGYEILALGYAAFYRHLAVIHGRWEALAELPTLLAQRRTIQASCSVAPNTLARWLEAPQSPLAQLRTQHQLATLLRRIHDT